VLNVPNNYNYVFYIYIYIYIYIYHEDISGGDLWIDGNSQELKYEEESVNSRFLANYPVFTCGLRNTNDRRNVLSF